MSTFDGKTFISDEFNQKNKKSTLKVGDVLLVQSGHIGHSAVVTPEHEGHNCHAMIVITPITEEVTGDFLSLYFNSSEMRQRFDQIRSGSTVPHLTCGAIREMRIGLPDLANATKLGGTLECNSGRNPTPNAALRAKSCGAGSVEEVAATPSLRGRVVTHGNQIPSQCRFR